MNTRQRVRIKYFGDSKYPGLFEIVDVYPPDRHMPILLLARFVVLRNFQQKADDGDDRHFNIDSAMPSVIEIARRCNDALISPAFDIPHN